MYKLTYPITYGQATDFVNECDAQDIMIYVKWTDNFNIPVDNYGLFKILTSKDPDEQFPMTFNEDAEGNIELNDLD